MNKIVNRLSIYLTVRRNLESVRAYEQYEKHRFYPRICVTDSQIQIDITNIDIRKKLEQNIEYMSSALPRNYVVKDYYITKEQDKLILNYIDVRKENRLIFDKPTKFYDWCMDYGVTQLLVDDTYYIDLRQTPHLLVTGATGSGKSYFVQSLITQALFKDYEIDIIDYKRSYQMFENTCSVVYTIEDIEKKMDEVIEELHERQVQMDEHLKEDATVLAYQKGFSLRLVVIEEYLALVNSNADKKMLAKIEKQILEICTLGRALNIHLFMTMQVSAATNLNSSIRANMSCRVVMGNVNRTILETTFGTGVAVPGLHIKKEVGDGLIYLNGEIATFMAPTLKFNLKDVLMVVSSNQDKGKAKNG